MKKGLKDNEYLYLIAKSVNSIEFMIGFVIICKILVIAFDVFNDLTAVPMP